MEIDIKGEQMGNKDEILVKDIILVVDPSKNEYC